MHNDNWAVFVLIFPLLLYVCDVLCWDYHSTPHMVPSKLFNAWFTIITCEVSNRLKNLYVCTPLKGFSLRSETVVPGGCLRSLSSSFHHPSVVMSQPNEDGVTVGKTGCLGVTVFTEQYLRPLKSDVFSKGLHVYSLTGSQLNGCTSRMSRWRINVFTCDSNAETSLSAGSAEGHVVTTPGASCLGRLWECVMAGTHSEEVNTVLLCIKGDKQVPIMSPNQSFHQSCCGQTVKVYLEAADEKFIYQLDTTLESVMADNRCVVGLNLPSNDQ